MSKTEENLVTVALNCSVKVSGTLYAPDDVIQVSESIAERLIAQKAADLYALPEEPEAAAPAADPEIDAEVDEPEAEDETDGNDDADQEDEKPAKGKGSRRGKAAADTDEA